MASLILTAVGSYVAGPIGGAIGGMAGSYIDQRWTFPLLFPKDPLQGPRLADLQVQLGSEGSAMKRVLGPRNRVAGTCIWKSDLIEVKSSSSVGKGGGGETVESYDYFLDIAISFCDTTGWGPVSAIRKIWADGKVIYDGEDTGKYEELAIYLGDQTQPDPVIEAARGTGNTPIFKNEVYIRIKRLALADYGNHPPNITALVEQQSSMSVGQAIAAILELFGFTSDQYDVTRLPMCLKGYIISGPQSGLDMLGPLLLAYGISCQEIAGKLVFFPKGQELVVTVPEADLGARLEGDESPVPMEVIDRSDVEAPSQVTIRFLGLDNDLQAATQTQKRSRHSSRVDQTIDVPLTMDRSEARAMAKRFLWVPEQERQHLTTILPPSYIATREGDAVHTTTDGVAHKLLVVRIARGADGRLEVSGPRYDPDVYTQDAEITAGTGGGEPYRPPATVGVIGDLPALTNDQVNKVGLYWGMCTETMDDRWLGGKLYRSEADDEFDPVGSTTVELTIGETVSVLHPGATMIWDDTNTVDVELFEGALEGSTDTQVLRGANRAAILGEDGWEIIAFVNAELIADNTYRLSRLLRGLRGTETAVAGHELLHKTFVLAQDGGANFFELGDEGLGSNDYYRFPALQGLISEYASTRQRCDGVTMKPFAPSHIKGQFAETFDLTITWMRRSKRIGAIFGPANYPLTEDELPEKYEIEIINGGLLGPIVREVEVENARTLLYTAAQQTEDGLVPGLSHVRVKVYQMSRVVGRGYPGHGVLIP